MTLDLLIPEVGLVFPDTELGCLLGFRVAQW